MLLGRGKEEKGTYRSDGEEAWRGPYPYVPTKEERLRELLGPQTFELIKTHYLQETVSATMNGADIKQRDNTAMNSTTGPQIPYFFGKKKDGTTQNGTRWLRKVEFELAKQYTDRKVPPMEMLSAIDSHLQFGSDAEDWADRNQMPFEYLG